MVCANGCTMNDNETHRLLDLRVQSQGAERCRVHKGLAIPQLAHGHVAPHVLACDIAVHLQPEARLSMQPRSGTAVRVARLDLSLMCCRYWGTSLASLLLTCTLCLAQ